MLRHSRFHHLFFTLSSLAFVGACEIGTEKREVVPDNGIVFSYFFSEQYAINNEGVRNFFSYIFGGVAIGGPDSKMELWEEPPYGCFLTAAYIQTANREVQVRKRVDAGELRLETAPDVFENLVKDSGLNYSHSKPLSPGTYTIHSPGLNTGILNFEQSFEVLALGDGLRVEAILDNGSGPVAVSQNLASPDVPEPTDPDYLVVFNRSSDNLIRFNAPAGTEYVRVNLSDRSNTTGGDITCFGPPNGSLLIPHGALNGFRSSSEGYMEVDFVKVTKETSIPKLKYLSIISTMRHFHGSFDYKKTDGGTDTVRIGLTEFR